MAVSAAGQRIAGWPGRTGRWCRSPPGSESTPKRAGRTRCCAPSRRSCRTPRGRCGVGRPQRRADRANPGCACRTQPRAQQQRPIAAHRPAEERHPGGVQPFAGQQRQQLAEHHRPGVLTGGTPVPVGIAPVDPDDGEANRPDLTSWARASSMPRSITVLALPSLPCRAITGRSGPV